MDKKKISLCRQPTAYFHERVNDVLMKQKIKTIKIAEFYLVDLLARYMLVSNLFEQIPEKNDQTSVQAELEPLAILYLKAQETGVSESDKVRLLKKLGDTSLYMSGFFRESLQNKLVDVNYYCQMGASAYRTLGDFIKESTFQTLYGELHDKFERFVDVLTEISQDALVQSNQNLLQLYETYRRTGNQVAQRHLSEKGLPATAVDLSETLAKKKKS